MRLNKKKLAALAMSAVMAASTMPFPVLAEEFTDMGEATVETAATDDAVEYKLKEDSINFKNENGTVKAYYTLTPVSGTGKDKEESVEAIEVPGSRKEGNCTKDTTANFTADIMGSPVTRMVVLVKAPGHKFDTDAKPADIRVTTKPSHENEGEGNALFECTVCGEKEESTTTVKIPAVGHTWSDELKYEVVSASELPTGAATNGNIKVDNGKVVLGTDGLPQLVDETKDGYYKAYYPCVDYATEVKNNKDCDKNKKYVKENGSEIITIPATKPGISENQELTIETKGIKTAVDASYLELKNGKYVIKEDKLANIGLNDCNVSGSITVTYKTTNGKTVSSVIPVEAPHHYDEKKVVVFSSKKEMNQCTVTEKADGELVVTNNSCSVPVAYEVVTICQTTTNKCSGTAVATALKNKWCEGKAQLSGYVVDSKAGVADPSLKHSFKGRDKVKELVDGDDKVTYSALQTIADANKGYMTLSKRTSCDTKEDITVTYICAMDNKTVETETVTVEPEDHSKKLVSEVDESTYVPATCTATGKQDIVEKCAYCGKEMSRNTIVIPKEKHSFYKADGTTVVQDDAYIAFGGSVVVDKDGETFNNFKADNKVYAPANDTLSAFKVTADAVVKCSECGETLKLNDDALELKVVDIKKEVSKGDAGSIKFETTYEITTKDNTKKTINGTYTVPYFSNVIAYLDRDLEKYPINGLNMDSDGIFRYYENGVFKKDFNGIADYNGAKFFVKDGIVASDLNHVQLSPDGKDFYYLTNGRITTEYTGLNVYDGEFFYIVNGKIDLTKNGLVEYDGKKFLVAVGRKVKECNGLWQDFDGTWYFLANGEVQDQFTGTTTYDGQTFTLENGKLVG